MDIISKLYRLFIITPLYYLYYFPGPLLPLTISLILFRRRINIKKHLFIAGAISCSLFFLFIYIPYHYQGYSELKNVSVSDGFGWTKNMIIGGFAYLYTFNYYGFLWLFIGLIQISFGSFFKNKVIDVLVRVFIVFLFCVFLLEFHLYNSSINIVLE